MKKSKFIIACPIFEDEINMALLTNYDIKIHFMDFRVHNNASRMKEEIESAIANGKNSTQDVSLLVGCECHCDIPIRRIAEDSNTKYPLEKNCIEIILGPERTNELQKNRTSIITQGWINMIKKFIEDEPLNEDNIRILMGHFDRLLLLDYGIRPITDEEILFFYDLVQVPIEIEQINLNYFQDALKRLLE